MGRPKTCNPCCGGGAGSSSSVSQTVACQQCTFFVAPRVWQVYITGVTGNYPTTTCTNSYCVQANRLWSMVYQGNCQWLESINTTPAFCEFASAMRALLTVAATSTSLLFLNAENQIIAKYELTGLTNPRDCLAPILLSKVTEGSYCTHNFPPTAIVAPL